MRLTPLDEETVVGASRVHPENIKRYLVDPCSRRIGSGSRRILGYTARDLLPRLR